jgi:hypothetical protein
MMRLHNTGRGGIAMVEIMNPFRKSMHLVHLISLLIWEKPAIYCHNKGVISRDWGGSPIGFWIDMINYGGLYFLILMSSSY